MDRTRKVTGSSGTGTGRGTYPGSFEIDVETRTTHVALPLPSSWLTLIELLVVIVGIAILATLVAPNVFRHVGAAKEATARSQIEMLGAALDAYRLDTGHYPTTQDGLAALWQAPVNDPHAADWRGPHRKKGVPLYLVTPRAPLAVIRGRQASRSGRAPLGLRVEACYRAMAPHLDHLDILIPTDGRTVG